MPTNSKNWWKQARALFEKEELSQPEIMVTFEDEDDFEKTVAAILKVTRGELPEEVTAWQIEDAVSHTMPVADAVQSIIAGDIEPIHLPIEQIIYKKVELPAIGLFIAPLELVVDYRTGSAWDAKKAIALIHLLTLHNGEISSPWWQAEHPDADEILNEVVKE